MAAIARTTIRKERDAMSESNPTSATVESTAISGRRTTRRRRIAIGGLAVLVAAALVTFGASSRPADPVEPLVLQKSDRLTNFDAAPSLRVATFNIHAGVGRDGVRDLNRTATALAETGSGRIAGGAKSALRCSRPSDFRRRRQAGNGVALRAGRETLVAQRLRHRPRHAYSPDRLRANSHADAEPPTLSRGVPGEFSVSGRTVHLLAVHIDKDMEQNTHDNQLHTIADLFLSLQEPAILMGDLNEFGSHPEIIRLIGTPGVRNALAGIARPTVKSNPIDWIFTRGFRTVHAEWRVNPASDHPVACAELDFSESTAEPAPAVHAASFER